jgi:hypothetical protein
MLAIRTDNTALLGLRHLIPIQSCSLFNHSRVSEKQIKIVSINGVHQTNYRLVGTFRGLLVTNNTNRSRKKTNTAIMTWTLNMNQMSQACNSATEYQVEGINDGPASESSSETMQEALSADRPYKITEEFAKPNHENDLRAQDVVRTEGNNMKCPKLTSHTSKTRSPSLDARTYGSSRTL